MFSSLAFVQTELCAALDRLSSAVHFNIVAYSKDVRCWKATEGVSVTRANVDEAKAWVRALTVQSSTNTATALGTIYHSLNVSWNGVVMCVCVGVCVCVCTCACQ
jgi:hypothetical protein